MIIYIQDMKERCSLVLFIYGWVRMGALLMREREVLCYSNRFLVGGGSISRGIYEIWLYLCIYLFYRYVVVHLVRCNIFFVFLSNVTYGAHEHLQFGI